MNKVEKQKLIDSLAEQLEANQYIYLTDTGALNAEKVSNLRRLCFKREVKFQVVKNALPPKGMEKIQQGF